MFSRRITEADSFLDMPLSTQVLYFHLNMGADDDGFVGNAKTIKRMIGASDDDLRLLIQKQYIFPFESGVVVIRDWKIHNYIQKDRYTETYYKAEKAMLEVQDNKQYQVIDGNNDKCIQNVSEMDTQVRIGKDRIGKDRLDYCNNITPLTNDVINVFEFYQKNFGILSPFIHDDIMDWCQTLSPELTVKAMQKAIESNKPYSYAKGILKNWLNTNIKTLEDAEAEEVQYQQRKSQNKTNRFYKKEEVKPGWMNKDQNNQLLQNSQELDHEDPSNEEIRAKLAKVMGGNK